MSRPKIQAALPYTFDENGREFTAENTCFVAVLGLFRIREPRDIPHLIRC